MPATRSFKRTIPPIALTFAELNQIDNYRLALAGGEELRDVSEPGHQYSGGLMELEDVDSDANGEECALADEPALFAYQDKDIHAKLRHCQRTESQRLESVRQGRVA